MMTTPTIKKVFQELVALLEANAQEKVETVLDQVYAIAASKAGSGGARAQRFHRDEETGSVIAVFCYYHKLWMSPLVVAFGSKSSSASGLNNMCKDGANKWTKQNNAKKAATAGILEEVVAGTLDPKDIEARKAQIEKEANVIIPREDGYGFETLEECLKAHDKLVKKGTIYVAEDGTLTSEFLASEA